MLFELWCFKTMPYTKPIRIISNETIDHNYWGIKIQDVGANGPIDGKQFRLFCLLFICFKISLGPVWFKNELIYTHKRAHAYGFSYFCVHLK